MVQKQPRGPYIHNFSLCRPVEWQPDQLTTLHRLMQGFRKVNLEIQAFDPAEMKVVLAASGLIATMSYESPQLSRVPTQALQHRISSALPYYADSRGAVTLSGFRGAKRQVDESTCRDLRFTIEDDELIREQHATTRVLLEEGAPGHTTPSQPFILVGREVLPKDPQIARKQLHEYREVVGEVLGPEMQALGAIAVEKVGFDPPAV